MTNKHAESTYFPLKPDKEKHERMIIEESLISSHPGRIQIFFGVIIGPSLGATVGALGSLIGIGSTLLVGIGVGIVLYCLDVGAGRRLMVCGCAGGWIGWMGGVYAIFVDWGGGKPCEL